MPSSIFLSKRPIIESYEYVTGYHGTDISTARAILNDGFSSTYGETHFAPEDNYWLAKVHGHKNALRANAGQYAVLGVNFNQIGHIANEYGSITFYHEELDLVEVACMGIYRVGLEESADELVSSLTKATLD